MKDILCTMILAMSISFLFGQNTWTQKADYGGCERAFGVSFVINNKAYVGGGESYGCIFDTNSELWEYDPTQDTWIQKSNIPTQNAYIHTFAIGEFGYLITGSVSSPNETHVWRYNPVEDLWDQLNNFPGDKRILGVGFNIGDKGYFGLGGSSAPLYQDIWEYDPSQDHWTQKADIPNGRKGATAFSIDSKGYVCLGSGFNDLWEFDPELNSWTQKANFGGSARQFPVSFVIGKNAYVGSGFDGNYTSDFWEYDSALNSWKEIDNMPGPVRQAAVAFSINNKGYFSNGYDGSFSVTAYKDLWEFGSTTTSVSELSNDILEVAIFPNPTSNEIAIVCPESKILELKVFNSTGQLVVEFSEINDHNYSMNLSEYKKGIYFLDIISSQHTELRKIVLK